MNGLKKILLIKDGEGRQLTFFLLLFVLLGAGMAIGRGTADALFLKRYGIEYLPVMYIALSAIYAVSFTAYAAFVDRLPPERFFYLLLVLQGGLLVIFWAIITYRFSEVVYPAYFLLYELASEILVIHATFYVGQNIDTMQSKRLMPLVFSGYQTGMVCGGLFLAMAVQIVGVENAIIAWCILIAMAGLLLLSWHKKQGVSPFYMPPPKSRRNRIGLAINEVRYGLAFIKRSSLLRNSSYALFFMVITYYVLTFSVSRIYTESFDSEAELTTFFGYLVAGTNLAALVMQLLVTNRVVEKVGVRRAKLIYPLTTIIAYLLLLVSPGFYLAIMASVNNSSVMPAFRNPVRQMFFNVLPDYIKGRARATSVALVMPVAMFSCGALILSLEYANDTSPVLVLGLVCAVLYFWFSYRMGKCYVAALINSLREKLYLPRDISKAGYRDNNDSVFNALARGVQNPDDNVSLSYTRMMIEAFPDESLELIMRRLQQADIGTATQMVVMIGRNADADLAGKLLGYADTRDDHFKAEIFDAVFHVMADECDVLIEECLMQDNPRLKVSGIKGAMLQKSRNFYRKATACWVRLLSGDINELKAAVTLAPIMDQLDHDLLNEFTSLYTGAYTELLGFNDEITRAQVYIALKDWQYPLPPEMQLTIAGDLSSTDPAVRSSAAQCLHLVANEAERERFLWRALADGHQDVRDAALHALSREGGNTVDISREWLLDKKGGSPRALKILLESMIKNGANHAILEEIVEKASLRASGLLGARSTLEHSDGNKSVKMVRTVIEERINQYIDIILIALESLMGSDVLSIVRAGLNSKEPAHRANAQEALLCLDNDRITLLLGCLIERDHVTMTRKGFGQSFPDMHAALSWCASTGDSWLSECSTYALGEVGG